MNTSQNQKYEYKVERNTTTFQDSSGKQRQLPVLMVTISGKPEISLVAPVMKKVRKETDKIKGKYIAVTDLSGLDAGKLLDKIIFHGLKLPYKKLLSVPSPSVISFVILSKEQMEENKIDNALEDINSADEGFSDYSQKYNYVFIKSMNEVPEILTKLVKEGEIDLNQKDE